MIPVVLYCLMEARAVRRTVTLLFALGFFLLRCSSLLVSQEPETTTVDKQTLQSLLDRIASLEASQKQLRDRVVQLEKEQPAEAALNADPPHSPRQRFSDAGNNSGADFASEAGASKG